MQETTTPKPKNLYPYQEADIETIFNRIENSGNGYRLLYQLPTGGGKTIVFAEIVKRFTEKYKRKAIVLTHRQELCRQTSRTLSQAGVSNKRITSSVQRLPRINNYSCYVAMVETLKNRIDDSKMRVDDIGLVIIDEAHHNSFSKLLEEFGNAFIIGVTATPLSSNPELPMKKTYKELIIGESIPSLIDKGFLAEGITYGYDVELTSLKTGTTGDFTVQSSDELYTTPAMLDLLMKAYETRAKGKKTLIFNNGIVTSRKVYNMFNDAGFPVRHLDNTTPSGERTDILEWFKKTPGSILTSVSILTTGFDEPTVQAVILNRATRSLTLYYQMIGRASRKLPRKKTFTIIDLGNNVSRFGNWGREIDWQKVFDTPEHYLEKYGDTSENTNLYIMPQSLRSLFPNSKQVTFDMEAAVRSVTEAGKKPKAAIQESIRQHAMICIENSESIPEARQLAAALEADISHRVKHYTQLLDKTTKSYRDWLMGDYSDRLNRLIGKVFNKISLHQESELKKM
jgi:superfamily II DNA or RNA helicase